MKKFSLGGLILGAFLGVLAGLQSGSGIFWLGMALAIAVILGTGQLGAGQMGRSEEQRAKVSTRRASS